MPEANPERATTPPTVAVHLGAHGPTARAVRDWCGSHRDDLRRRRVVARTTWSGLRDAVPALDWRSDRSRRQLREYLTGRGPVLFSSHAPLGPAYRHTGGPLYPTAPAGVDGVAAALADVPWTLHLTIGGHAETVVESWVAAVRGGHRVSFEDFLRATAEGSWVPLVEHLVRVAGSDRVTVHDAAAAAASGRPDAGPAVLAAALGQLLGEPTTLGSDAASAPERHWSARQVEVALTALPHLRSWDERRALRGFVDRTVDTDGEPVRPLTGAQRERLAARDADDRARLSTLVEVR
ncbi:hypothetical protein [Isoptericola sp. AK164]|uniref:hypothetical protein n=1 Tax=Isoptericola sp. AK164 TaxID=3024246 RepID=UPI002418690A|nr:hypothetical protein [Isoptericola sp. AK164]